MRQISTALKNKLLLSQQTLYNGANLYMDVKVLRPTTPLTSKDYLLETIVDTIPCTVSSVAVRRMSYMRSADYVYVAYINSGTLYVKRAMVKYPITAMTWYLIETIANATNCSLVFDGSFVKNKEKAEFITEATPWLFYITSAGALMAGILGGTYEVLVAANVTSLDAVRGITSPLKDIDQGLLVFYIIAGSVYYNSLVNGVWEGQETVDIAPANAVYIKVERTFDWRIALHVTDNTGILYEVFTKMSISGWINVEYLTARIEQLVSVYEVDYAMRMLNENISVEIEQTVVVLWGLAPEVLSIANEDDGFGDFGFKVRIIFDADLFSVSGNEGSFSMVDDSASGYDCTAIEQVGRELILTFADFNNATNPIVLSYTPGTISGEVEALEAFAIEFTATGLDPVSYPVPQAVSAKNIIDWEVI